MIEEARIRMDRGDFFNRKLDSLRPRLEELGAQKIQRGGDWYWDLKPDLKADEAIIL